jgi:CRISPR-associated protein (TIGR03986 family)
MEEIKSSYRFIPVSSDQEYYSPEWKNKVSQDMPFKNGVSGSINYTLKANTAIFVKGSDGNFCNVNGKYFIPGTTIKGCTRSVLEIMSFGHLDSSRVKDNKDKDRFAFRDLNDPKGYMVKMGNVYCGWLTDDGKIINWGKPVHIKYESIIEKIKIFNLSSLKEKTAIEKYKIAQGYITGFFSIPQKLQNARNFDQRKFCYFDDKGKRGSIIFSGGMKNKKSDFVLLENDESKNVLSVNKEILNSFHEIYGADCNSIPYNNKKGGKAVFFTLNNNNVETIGLSCLHKYFAKNSIRDAIPAKIRGGNPDMADVIFGSAINKIKGRVQFCAAKQQKAELLLKEGESILNVLGSPRASYYPTYLQNHATWDTAGAIISGIKRYPIKPQYDISILEFKDDKDKKKYEEQFGPCFSNVYESKVNNRYLIPRTEDGINFQTISQMKPLKEGAEFNGSIKFHNLKEEEFGALYSALTFHGHSSCKHSIGQAKSYGYGNISLCNISVNFEEPNDKDECMLKFEKLMDDEMPEIIGKEIKWKDTIQIKELLAMAKGFENESLIDLFSPMDLTEFGKAKRDYMTDRKTFSSYIEIVRPENNKNYSHINSEVDIVANARVAFFDRNTKTACLISGKDISKKPLDMSGKPDKLRIGDSIQVKVKMKGGSVYKLIFLKKL